MRNNSGNLEDISQEVDCLKPVTVYQTIVRSLKDARYLIDKALLEVSGGDWRRLAPGGGGQGGAGAARCVREQLAGG